MELGGMDGWMMARRGGRAGILTQAHEIVRLGQVDSDTVTDADDGDLA